MALSLKMNFRLSDGSREVSSEYIFTVGKNQGTSEVFAASDLPKDIRDYQRREFRLFQ